MKPLGLQDDPFIAVSAAFGSTRPPLRESLLPV